jgi:small subunit ribosomal protein S2
MVKTPTIEEMLKSGMHFGHRVSKWHPKMAPYIYTQKSGVHIFDLDISKQKLADALEYMKKLASENKQILFVGTKNQVKHKLKTVSIEMSMPYANEKWLAGLLTNFSVVRKLIKKYRDLKEKKISGKLEKYTKKERLDFEREMEKMEKRVGGLVNLDRLPDAMFIWDIKKEETALFEAKKMKIPVIAICDTNVNPTEVAYVIPSNDDATKTIELLLNVIKDAVLEGKVQKNISSNK